MNSNKAETTRHNPQVMLDCRRHVVSASFELIVNATPVGMRPNEGVSPLNAKELNAPCVMDLIYRPMQTELLRIAAKKGIGVISGAEMFLAQGFAQWELFMGRRAPEAAMRRAVLAQLSADESSRGIVGKRRR